MASRRPLLAHHEHHAHRAHRAHSLPRLDVAGLAWSLPSASRVGLVRAFTTFATQDWLVASYLFVFGFAVLFGHGPRRDAALAYVVADNAVFWSCLLAVRGELVRGPVLRGVLYRVGLIGVVVATFFQLHFVHPVAIAEGTTRDAALFALDMRLFGVEPALAWDRFVTPETTDWFAFFYYGYFYVVLAYVVGAMLFERRARLLAELSLGILVVVCVGHLVYFLVPGRGPYLHLEGAFAHPLEGRFWWPLVEDTVRFGDEASRRDIFPSLHTALPTFLTLWTLRRRRERPYRWAVLPMAFVTTQIVIATMFLRWHYLVDVIAGVALAVVALVASAVVPRIEEHARALAEVPHVWPGAEG